jgi:hypothetical protein
MAQIFRARGKAFRRSHALSAQQVKVMRAIERCRTEALGGHADFCAVCGYVSVSYNSCRDRHCAKCKSLSEVKWIDERCARILPTNYFHVVFTLPSSLRPLAVQAPRAIYDLIFDAASRTLLDLGGDPKYLGGQIAFTAVLHTWTRKLELHPHLHCIVTGGGLSPDAERWVPARGKDRFLFPGKVLSRLFRGKFLDKLARRFEAGELGMDPADNDQRARFDELKKRLYGHEWLVYAKRPFAGPEQVYRYLGRYTHRVGISNQRLREIADDTVTFATRNGKTATLSHDEFMRRFLLHVLPHGFVKIRHFGLMASSNATTKLETARRLIDAECAPAPEKASTTSWEDLLERLTGEDPRKCPRCGSQMLRYDLRHLPAHVKLALVAATGGKGPDP